MCSTFALQITELQSEQKDIYIQSEQKVMYSQLMLVKSGQLMHNMIII